jgi:predicted dithiol-disulfide oxidoreductase (DUF899 family)
MPPNISKEQSNDDERPRRNHSVTPGDRRETATRDAPRWPLCVRGSVRLARTAGRYCAGEGPDGYTLTDGFDGDFGVDEWHGTNAFIRDGDSVFRTYFINNRGDEALGTGSSISTSSL